MQKKADVKGGGVKGSETRARVGVNTRPKKVAKYVSYKSNDSVYYIIGHEDISSPQ